MEQTISRLKSQIQSLEKNKVNTDELMRALNATLMERETEVSILKLKLTRMQTNPSSAIALNSASSVSSVKQDPCHAFTTSGRSNSEFDRSSFRRSTMIAGSTVRSSLDRLEDPDQDSSIWATVPEELTPSKRPQLLKRCVDTSYYESPLSRNRLYRTLPQSMKKPVQQQTSNDAKAIDAKSDSCQVTNLDDNIQQSVQCDSETNAESQKQTTELPEQPSSNDLPETLPSLEPNEVEKPKMPNRMPSSPVKLTSGIKKIFDKLRRSDSTQSKTDLSIPDPSPFKRGSNRSTLIASSGDSRVIASPMKQAMSFQTDKPFAEWTSEMIANWLTMIGLSMYATQCRRWVKCGAHIMNATPAEVDKWLGITNHLHSKKLRLAISELNGDCDKITKAAAKLDYLWVARWLDDIGLPQHKEAFINARVDGRVLNYLTVDDLASLGVKGLLHHASIKCGIRVLRSINFDLQFLKRRATADEIERMNAIRQNMNKMDADNSNLDVAKSESLKVSQTVLPLWTCHRVMEWLRLIDFSEFASNLRGSGVHGGLIVFEAGFNIDTMCTLLNIPTSRTLLRRHLSTFFNELIGDDLLAEKRQYNSTQLNPTAEVKTTRKNTLWLPKLKSSRVNQTSTDEYLCPMYPLDPPLIRSKRNQENQENPQESQKLPRILESVNV